MQHFFILFISLFVCSCSHGSSKQSPPLSSLVTFPVTQKRVVIIDAGHGGTDQGARASGIVEKKRTLSIAILTKRELNALGYRVIFTRDRDDNVPLQRRVAIANRHKDAVFISIHLNSAPAKEAQGIEIFYCNKSDKQLVCESKKLAADILSGMLEKTGAESRGVKRGTFHVIRETEVPSVLVEAGFITNQDESVKLKNQPYLEKIAAGIASGIHRYIQDDK